MTGVLIKRPCEAKVKDTERRPWDNRGRHWTDVATSQGTSGASRGGKKVRTIPLQPLEEVQPSLQKPSLPAARTVYGICHSSPRTPTQCIHTFVLRSLLSTHVLHTFFVCDICTTFHCVGILQYTWFQNFMLTCLLVRTTWFDHFSSFSVNYYFKMTEAVVT